MPIREHHRGLAAEPSELSLSHYQSHFNLTLAMLAVPFGAGSELDGDVGNTSSSGAPVYARWTGASGCRLVFRKVVGCDWVLVMAACI